MLRHAFQLVRVMPPESSKIQWCWLGHFTACKQPNRNACRHPSTNLVTLPDRSTRLAGAHPSGVRIYKTTQCDFSTIDLWPNLVGWDFGLGFWVMLTQTVTRTTTYPNPKPLTNSFVFIICPLVCSIVIIIYKLYLTRAAALHITAASGNFHVPQRGTCYRRRSAEAISILFAYRWHANVRQWNCPWSRPRCNELPDFNRTRRRHDNIRQTSEGALFLAGKQ